jgi:RES domain-containing protein
MPNAYRIAKAKYPVFDGTGAYLEGGRWNSPGQFVIYASSCLAGSLVEVLTHAGRRGKLPGAHRCAVAEIPDDLEIEFIDEGRHVGWDAEDSVLARELGDDWLSSKRTAVLSVPATTARPYGRHLLLNPSHGDYGSIVIRDPVPLLWDNRLFRV